MLIRLLSRQTDPPPPFKYRLNSTRFLASSAALIDPSGGRSQRITCRGSLSWSYLPRYRLWPHDLERPLALAPVIMICLPNLALTCVAIEYRGVWPLLQFPFERLTSQTVK